MEFTNTEARAIEAVTQEVEQECQLLDDLQLSLVGGGNVIVTCG